MFFFTFLNKKINKHLYYSLNKEYFQFKTLPTLNKTKQFYILSLTFGDNLVVAKILNTFFNSKRFILSFTLRGRGFNL